VRATLIDTGPIVAFLNQRDRHHRWAVETLATVAPPALTCEAVLSEAAYLVRGLPGGPERVLELVTRGMVKPAFRLEEQATAVKALLSRYRSARIDLADACLVRMTEQVDAVLLTLDTEFRDIYRRHGRSVIPVLMPERGRA
jgi:predicted nucleic acid-binding protein